MGESSLNSGRPRVTTRSLVAALRVHQWVKNLLVLVPVILDHQLLNVPVVLRGVVAFAAFCLAASGAYILNDLWDLETDQRHPSRRNRPFASGTLSPRLGKTLAPTLFAAAVLLSLLIPMRSFFGLLVLYMTVTTAYSAYLKRVPVLDVLLLAGLYTLRVLAGVAATGVPFSTWLLGFSMFLFLSLAFLKRYAEVSGLGGSTDEKVPRRGYLRSDREWLGSMGAASGYLSVLVLALYVSSDQVVALYRVPVLLWLVCPLLLFWISRMWLLAYRGRLHDDPIVATARDPVSYVIGGLVALVLLAAL
ncbi:MAG: UbiA family prenyltransferase [Gemmatimonadales bacterium]